MKPLAEELFNKLVIVSEHVKQQMQLSDIIIPIRNNNGSVTVGAYTLLKTSAGFYAIINSKGLILIDYINLPQTAAILANKLALGKFIDRDLVSQDKQYGYALFEEILHKKAAERSKTKDPEYAALRMIKFNISKLKKDGFKRNILNSFEKMKMKSST
jgi:hypothetical protein